MPKTFRNEEKEGRGKKNTLCKDCFIYPFVLENIESISSQPQAIKAFEQQRRALNDILQKQKVTSLLVGGPFFTNEIGAQNSDAGQVIPTSCLGTSREGNGEGGERGDEEKKHHHEVISSPLSDAACVENNCQACM